MSVLRGLGDEARQKHMTVANIRSKMQAMSGCLGLLFHECFELHGAPGLGFLAWGPPPGGSSASTTRSCVIKTFAIFAAPARPTTPRMCPPREAPAPCASWLGVPARLPWWAGRGAVARGAASVGSDGDAQGTPALLVLL